ncbi:tandem-95 repeat protein [Mycolicibacterium sp. PAM1]|uniref:Ig-like domain-containing protein n=1 Tax=Mycolicibacterium sp. PAM1 TaxID=2853535 RepID=UPI001C3DFE19|nr:Ig-like domain-containing protein [Mycolicibacterium sp. PAM1]MBV5242381.1 tandem-95 repeat protein [Mycolicibacterium sp. PAM1]
MGYAKYVGRVGALALALGIGTAVATPAWAESPSSTESSSSESKAPQKPLQRRGMSQASSDNATSGSGTSGSGTSTSATDDTRADDADDDAESDDSVVVEEAEEPVVEPQEVIVVDDDVEPSEALDDAPVTPSEETQSSATTTPSSDDTQPEPTAAAESTSDPEPTTADSASEDSDAPSTTSTTTYALTATSPAGVPAPAPLVRQPQTPIGVILGGPVALLDIAAKAINMLFSPDPSVPGDSPLLLGVLAFVRREVQRTFFNSTPGAVADAATTSEGLPTRITVLDNDTDPNPGDILTITDYTQAANGTVTLNPDGSFTYTPTAGFSGSDTFTYTISDDASPWHSHGLASLLNGGHSSTATVTISVAAAPVNEKPTAVADSATTAEDTPAVIDVRANDTDPDGDALTVTAVGSPLHGTVVVLDGKVSYTPTADYHGTDTFTYTISDGELTDTATVTVTVTPVNDLPVATNDAVTVAGNSTGNLINVLSNDSDPDADALTVTILGTPSQGGLVSVNADSTVAYTPATGFSGTETFTYTVSDGSATSIGTATVNVTPIVVPVNTPPVAVNDSYAMPTGATSAVVNVVANDTDPDGDTLTVVDVTGADHGTTTFTGGTITYTPTTGYAGTEVLTYTVSDGTDTATATLTITVPAATPVNQPPVAVNDSYTMPTGATSAVVDVVSNDTDADNDTLSVTAVTGAINGTTTFSGGSITYTPTTGYAGTEVLTYTVTDGTDTTTAKLTITVPAVNRAPVAADDAVTMTPGAASITVNVVANDTDPDANPLSVTAVTGVTNGTATFTGSTITYTPVAGYSGVQTLTYTVSDGSLTDTATLTITVPAVNGAPIPGDTEVRFDEASGVTYGTVSASDPEGKRVTYHLVGDSEILQGVVLVDSDTGAWAVKPTSRAQFESFMSHDGTFVTFTINATDGELTTPIDVTAPIQPAVLPGVVQNAGSWPVDVAVGNGGTLYVASGKFVNVIHPDGTSSTEPVFVSDDGVRSVAVGPDGRVYATDGNSSVVTVIDPAADHSTDSFAVIAGSAGALAFDIHGHLYVTSSNPDLDNYSIVVLRADGTPTDAIELDREPTDIAVSADGRIFITFYDSVGDSIEAMSTLTADLGRASVLVLNSDGSTNSALEVEGSPFGVAVDEDGNLLITDPTSSTLRIIRPDGTILRSFQVGEAPSGIAIGTGGRIYVSDYQADTILVLPPDTKFYDIDWDTDGYGVTRGYLNPFGPGLGEVVSYTASQVDPQLGSLELNPRTGQWTFTPTLQARANAAGTATEADDYVRIEFTASAGSQYTATVPVDIWLNPTPNPDPNSIDKIHVTGVAVTSDQKTYLSGYSLLDEEGIVALLNPDETFTVVAHLEGRPSSILAGIDGRLYVIDGTEGKVLAVDPADSHSVSLLASIPGGTGLATDDSGRLFATSIASDPDNPESSIGRLTVLEQTGQILGTPIVLDAQPTGLAVGPDGKIYLIAVDAAGSGGALTILNGNLTFDHTIALPGDPRNVAVASDGRAFISNGKHVLVVEPSTGSVRVIDIEANPSTVDIDDDGYLYVSRIGAAAIDRLKLSDITDTAIPTTPEEAPLVLTPAGSAAGTDRTVVAWGSSHGELTTRDDGTIVYTPNIDFNGYDTVTFAHFDSDGRVISAVASYVRVAPVNDLPGAEQTYATAGEETALQIAPSVVLANAFDADLDVLTIVGVTEAAHGAATLNPDGTIGYTPTTGFSGQDSFAVIISDGHGGVTEAPVNITVLRGPEASADFLTAAEDTPLAITPDMLLSNDRTADGVSPTIIAVSGRAHLNADGTITYTPASEAAGEDTFVYTIADARGATATATAVVSVTAVNDTPSVKPDEPYTLATIGEHGDVTGRVNVTDPDSTLTYDIASDTEDGTVSVDSNGNFTFLPTISARENAWATAGDDTATFSIVVSDGATHVVVAVTVPIIPRDPHSPNQAPIAGSTLVQLDSDSAATYGSVSADDPHGASVTYSLVGPHQTAQGVVLVNQQTGAWVFKPTPEARFASYITPGGTTVSFTIIASDGDLSTPITVTAPILPSNEFSETGDTIPSGGGWPLSVAVDEYGVLYVANGDGYLHIVNPDGSLVAPPIEIGGYSAGVALGRDGRVYVTNADLGVVSTVDPDDHSLSTFAHVPNATAMAFADDGRLYVVSADADGAGTLNIVGADGGAVLRTVALGSQSYGVTVGNDGRVYATLYDASAVKVFTADGSLIKTINYHSETKPFGVAISPSGLLFVSDPDGGGDVFVSHPDASESLRSFSWVLGGSHEAPTGIAVDSEGNVHVADGYTGDIQVHQPRPEFDWWEGILDDWQTDEFGVSTGVLNPFGPGLGDIVNYSATLNDPAMGTIVVDPSTGRFTLTPSAQGRANAAAYSDSIEITFNLSVDNQYSTTYSTGLVIGGDNRFDPRLPSSPPVPLHPQSMYPRFPSTQFRALALDSEGRLYALGGHVYTENAGLSELNNSSLTIVNTDGSITRVLSLRGNAHGMAIGPDGYVYISNLDGGTISVLDPGNDYAEQIVATVERPIAIAVDKQGVLYVTSDGAGGGTLTIINRSLPAAERSISLPGGSPTSVAVGADGRIYVVTGTTLSMLSPDATVFDTFDLHENSTWAVAVDDSTGLVHLSDGDHLLSLDPGTGAYTSTVPYFTEYFGDPRTGGIALAADGRIYMASQAAGFVLALNARGALPPANDSDGVVTIALPHDDMPDLPNGILVGPDGRVFVTVGDWLTTFDPDHGQWGSGRLDGGRVAATSVAYGPDGHLYFVSDLGELHRLENKNFGFGGNSHPAKYVESYPLSGAVAMAPDSDGNLYVVTRTDNSVDDSPPNRLIALNSSNYLDANVFELGDFTPSDLTVSPDGHLYVVSLDGRLMTAEVDREGQFTAEVRDLGLGAGYLPSFVTTYSPMYGYDVQASINRSVAVGPTGVVYVTDPPSLRLVAISPNGEVSWARVSDVPSDVSIGDDGRIYLTNPLDATVSILSPDAMTWTSFAANTPTNPEFNAPIVFSSPIDSAPWEHSPAVEGTVTGLVSALFPGASGQLSPSSEATSYTLASQLNPLVGRVVLNGQGLGSWEFIPTLEARIHAGNVLGQTESVSFVIIASNGTQSVPITVVATISPETRPQAGNPPYIVASSGPWSTIVWTNIRDADLDRLTFTVDGDPAYGSTEIYSDTGTLVFSPSAQARYNAWLNHNARTATFTVTATDGLFSESVNVTVSISPLAPNVGSTLQAGRTMTPNFFMQSTNGRYRLWLQGDGNLVLYDEHQNHKALWATNKFGGNHTVTMQTDGNLVVYSGSTAVWASGTNGKPGARLELQDDGNLVIYQGTKVVWDRIGGIPRPPLPKPAPVLTPAPPVVAPAPLPPTPIGGAPTAVKPRKPSNPAPSPGPGGGIRVDFGPAKDAIAQVLGIWDQISHNEKEWGALIKASPEIGAILKKAIPVFMVLDDLYKGVEGVSAGKNPYTSRLRLLSSFAATISAVPVYWPPQVLVARGVAWTLGQTASFAATTLNAINPEL